MDNEVDIPSISTASTPALLAEELKRSREYLKDSAERANTASADYRKTVDNINDKITLLSAGSLSLLLTFLGVLMSRAENLPDLSYKYIVLAFFLFLITIMILLTVKWLQAMYVFKINNYYYLRDRKSENDINLRIAQVEASSIIDKDTGQIMKPAILTALVNDMRQVSKELDVAIAKDKKISGTYLYLSRNAPFIAFTSFILAYAFAVYFFIGVISFLNS